MPASPVPRPVWLWPAAELGAATRALALRSGLAPPSTPAAVYRPPDGLSERDLRLWLELVTARLGVELDSRIVTYADADLRGADGPCLVEVREGQERSFVALLGRRRGRFRALAADGSVMSLPAADLATRLRAPFEGPAAGEVEALLSGVGLPGRRREIARREVLLRLLANQRVSALWTMSLPPGAQVAELAGEVSLARFIGAYGLGFALRTVLSFGLWWVLWQGALRGQPSAGWLAAWALAIVTLQIPTLLEPWLVGQFSVRLGWVLRRRLLAGALRLEPEEVRHLGVGELLGRTLEGEDVEHRGIHGALLGLSQLIALALLVPVLGLGSGGWPHAALLVAWTIASVAFVRPYVREKAAAAGQRLKLATDMVEKMVGHETRIAQLPAAEWHQDEDAALAAYAEAMRAVDRWQVLITSALPGIWMILSFALLAPGFVLGRIEPAPFAIALGATLFAALTLETLGRSIGEGADAWVAWQKVRPVFDAASRPVDQGEPDFAIPGPGAAKSTLRADVLGYRYPARDKLAVADGSILVEPGARVLVEGPSGGGKSTFLALLTGLRAPTSGLLLLDGLDRETLGAAGLGRRIALAPQFHENHVFLGSLSFNLLLARGWPPTRADLELAEAICKELGLGPLLERMPGGLEQQVGEIGWQLSHGERSRLYVARALLQDADVVCLDESFAALDPDNLRLTLDCVDARVSSLIVNAHP